MFKSLFCSHKMKVVFEYTAESSAEQIMRLTGKLERPSDVYAMTNMTKKNQVVIAYCDKCGKMKKFKNTL